MHTVHNTIVLYFRCQMMLVVWTISTEKSVVFVSYCVILFSFCFLIFHSISISFVVMFFGVPFEATVTLSPIDYTLSFHIMFIVFVLCISGTGLLCIVRDCVCD